MASIYSRIDRNVNKNTKHQIPSYEKAILSFLKEVERTSVKFKQIYDIHTKLKYFKDYCFSIGIGQLDEISRTHANTYIVKHSQTKLTSATLNILDYVHFINLNICTIFSKPFNSWDPKSSIS